LQSNSRIIFRPGLQIELNPLPQPGCCPGFLNRRPNGLEELKMKQHRLCHLVVTLLLAIIVSSVQAKHVDDVVILKNGDRLTGEIKGLQRGELKFKASYMAEAVRLDWARVDRLESKSTFLVYLANGTLLTDSVQLVPANTTETSNFAIGAAMKAVRVKQMDVLRITPVEARFWRQLEGSIDFGFGFTSGNDQYQTELIAAATYRRGDQSLTGSVDSAFSGQTKGESSARREFALNYRKQLSPKWYAGGIFGLLSSDQQSLDLRTTVGGVLGRNIRQTERTRFSIFGGLAATREKYSATVGTPRATNADAIAGLDFATFRFTTTDLTSRFSVFPSLTTPGRMRMQFSSDLRLKIAADLYWGFHVYENFDSKPPVRADKNDLGISTSVGWKF
jgi:putative salt-induced outer membrane protein YdiY